MDKASKLASIFGSQTTPLQSDSGVSVPVHHDYGSVESKSDSFGTVGESENGYQLLKEYVESLSDNVWDIRGLVSEWLGNNQPMIFCQVSNDLAPAFEEELQTYMIPVIRLSQKNNTVFLARSCDVRRFERALNAVRFRYGNASMIFNYDLFRQFSEKFNIQTAYFKNLTEEEMECIRRETVNSGRPKKYAMFRMNGNKWGLGFKNTDGVTKENGDFADSCFLEGYLKMALLTSGLGSDNYVQTLMSDVAVDRLASAFFAPSLENHDEVFVVDTVSAKKAMKITKDGFKNVKISKVGGKWKLKESKFYSFDDLKSRRVYRKELMKMKHRQLAYQMQEMLEIVNVQLNMDKKQAQNRENLIIGKKILAHNMYCIFAEKYKDKMWFAHPDKLNDNVREFSTEVQKMLQAFRDKEELLDYSEHENNVLFNTIFFYRIPENTFTEAQSKMYDLDIGALQLAKHQTIESNKSLREQIAYLQKATSRGAEVDISQLQL